MFVGAVVREANQPYPNPDPSSDVGMRVATKGLLALTLIE